MENGVFKNVSTILIANPAPVTRAPSARTFASLCSLVASAEKQSPHKAARIPLNRFAVIEIPIPVPQIVIPIWVFCLFFRFAQLEEYFQSVSLLRLFLCYIITEENPTPDVLTGPGRCLRYCGR